MKAFIDDHRAVYGVEPICRVLPIAPSTYRAHAACAADPSRASARVRRDAALRPEITRVWEGNCRVRTTHGNNAAGANVKGRIDDGNSILVPHRRLRPRAGLTRLRSCREAGNDGISLLS